MAVVRVRSFLISREYEALSKSGELENLDMYARDEKVRQHAQNEQVVCYSLLFQIGFTIRLEVVFCSQVRP